MEDNRHVSADTTLSVTPSQQSQPDLYAVTGPRHLARSVARVLVNDWRTHKYALFAALLFVLTIIVVMMYYYNHPQPESTADTPGYLTVVQAIQMRGLLVNTWRLPGYPLLIVLVYALTGQGNLLAVSIAQAVFFVLATLELYVLAVLVLRGGWVAFFIGLLCGTNLTILSYVKPIMSEALALWLLVSLALVVALFVNTPRARFLWLVTVFTLALFLTRPEWIFLPVPLFAYLLLVAAWRGVARHLLPHALVSLVLLYAILGNYIYINAMANHFVGVTVAQNYNTLGKVLQYNMQDEAPPQYKEVERLVDRYVARGIRNPFRIIDNEPSLARNYGTPASEYAQAIIERHPGEFLTKSVQLGLTWLTSYYYGSQVDPIGPFGTPLIGLQSVFHALYSWNILFPGCALLWLVLLCWRRTARQRIVQLMGAVVLLVLYGLIVTTVGVHQEYPRLHIPFSPLLILLIGGSLLVGALQVAQYGPRVLAWLASHYFRCEQVSASTGNLLAAALGGIGVLLFTFGWLMTHALASQVGVVFFLVMSVASISHYFRPGEQR